MTSTRISTFTIDGPVLELFISDCTCGVVFGMPKDLERRRREDRQPFFCPNGHRLTFQGKTDAQKLEEAKVRETALKDQVSAAVREAETVRVALLRDRQRFANGVCPCCNRSFENVRRHMSTQHPDYDVTKVKQDVTFKCSCGRSFGSLRGLRIHQGQNRLDAGAYAWHKPQQNVYWAHLTRV